MSRRSHNPSSELFKTSATLPAGGRVVVLHSDDPALARWAIAEVGSQGNVTAFHASYSALRNLERVAGLTLSEDVYPKAEHGPADVVLLEVPKGRSLTRAFLWTATQVLRPDGVLYLAGPNAGGAKSAIKDAGTLFGAAPVLTYRSGHRIATATRPADVAIPAEWDDPAPWRIQMREVKRPEGNFHILTLPGVFSWDHLDEGTALLLDHIGVEPETDVLDVGCGYGIIGLVAARFKARVVLVDDDLLAVRCARASVTANDLDARCTVLPSDVTSAVQDRQFDLILSNPPFHHGVDVTTNVTLRLIREAYDRLRPGGRLRMVANRFLPYSRPMQETFGQVTTIAATGSYHVLESVRSD